MRHLISPSILLYCSLGCAVLYALTFNNSLDKKAEIDIFVSKTQPASVTFVSPITTDAEGRIASYSFFYKSSNAIMYWEHLYSQYLPTFLHPEMRIVKPTQKTNAFSIGLGATVIHGLIGEVLSQVFVTVRQRTYTYNASTGKINFYAYVPLKQSLVSLDATLSVTASGVINPAVFDGLPDSVKILYPKAEGGVVVT